MTLWLIDRSGDNPMAHCPKCWAPYPGLLDLCPGPYPYTCIRCGTLAVWTGDSSKDTMPPEYHEWRKIKQVE